MTTVSFKNGHIVMSICVRMRMCFTALLSDELVKDGVSLDNSAIIHLFLTGRLVGASRLFNERTSKS